MTKPLHTDACVADFHRAFGYPVRTVPQVPSEDEIRLRLRLIAEEFVELLQAHDVTGFNSQRLDEAENHIFAFINEARLGPIEVDLADAADALADLDYVIAGTRLQYGIPGRAVFDEVHRSNLAKAGGKHDEHGKLQKPEGWTPPDIESVLRKYGWEP